MPLKSEIEEQLAAQLQAVGIPPPEREYLFARPHRRWRADFAWPDNNLLVEVYGGQWTGGRHARGSGVAGDWEKMSAAARLGYAVLQFSRSDIETGWAVGLVYQFLFPEKRNREDWWNKKPKRAKRPAARGKSTRKALA